MKYEYLNNQTILIDCQGIRILLDPTFGIDCDYESIDVILVSTYKSPVVCHILEYSSFKGEMYMTVPTLEYLPLYIQETTSEFTDFDLAQMKRKVKTIYYHHVQRFLQLEFSAIPSGTGIGYANWSIRFGSMHFVYSHCWTKPARQVTKMDVSSLTGCDLLFATQNLIPSKPIVAGKGWVELWPDIYDKIKQKGHVIIVTEPIEDMFDSLESLYRLVDSAGVKHVPIHIVSSIAKASLSLTNIFSEWMDHQRQQQTMSGNSWILFDLLEKSKIICHSSTQSLQEYPKPQIIVCTRKTMVSCLELSNSFDGFLCLVPDSDERDVPVSQYPDCQFKLYHHNQSYTPLESLRSFFNTIQPKMVIDSKVRGELDVPTSMSVTISNQILSMKVVDNEIDITGAIYHKDKNLIDLSSIAYQ